MKKVEIYSRVENGKLTRNRRTIEKCIAAHEGKDITITIQRTRKRRSNNQNAYYWGIIVPLVADGLEALTGEIYGKDDVHAFLKGKFNVREIVNPDSGEILKVPKSTTENTTTDMEIYHEDIRRFADEFLNVRIPLPNEQMYIE